MREITRAKTMEEAYKAKRKADDAVYISGGTEVLRLDSSIDDEAALIDVNSFLSHEIEKDRESLTIGAGATFQEIIDNADTPEWLKKACHYMASYSLRQQATIGGNIAALRDDSYLIPTLVAAGAILKTYGNRGIVTGALADYVANGGSRYTVLSITIPLDVEVSSHRFARSASSHSALNMAYSTRYGAAAAIKGSGIIVGEERILKADFTDDLTGSGEYKKYLAGECLAMLKEGRL